MQIDSSIPSIVPNPHPVLALPAPASAETVTTPDAPQDVQILETTNTLNEIVAVDAPLSVDTASLQSDSGSGSIPVKLATVIYSLNHSFDVQKQMIDLLI